MSAPRRLVLLAALSVLGSQAFAFNLNDAANLYSASQGGKGGDASAALLSNPQNLQLLAALKQLKVTPQQAVGGTGAMLGLAKNQLPNNEYSQLTQTVPGLEKFEGANGLAQLSSLSGLLGKSAGKPVSPEASAAVANVNNPQDLSAAFGALGMDSGMVGQFAPLLLQYLGQQGVGNGLLGNLGSLWATPGA
ncbi:MAG: DUF2780 domain-containing protein [Pseudomonas sp.]